ncbi:uncharacterized protein [Dermacentor albipictus]|uniref:uncharacterized protein isoform X6 n=1 Tax=Dermacentor albipictus TaxID=60249 RepID=UPI0038FCAFC2
MAPPRIIRTPSEEREFINKRKEARRARIRVQTQEQREAARAKHAEIQRRRRQNAAVREREAEARRQRRQDPELREKEAAERRARRKDAAVREREAEAKRQRRQDATLREKEAAERRARREDLAVRKRETETRRQRRQDPVFRLLEAAERRARREDAAVREREAEAKRQRRQDPAVRQLEAAKHRARREDPAVREREAEARRQRRLREHTSLFGGQFGNPFGYTCDVCHRLGFKADLSPIRTPHVPLLSAEFPNEDVPSFMLCSTCQKALQSGTVPALSRSNICLDPAVPTELLEVNLVCRSDDEDSESPLPNLAKQFNSEQKAQESKVDCCLQTDGTGKVVVAVQTEECPKLQSHEPTKDAKECESECPLAMEVGSEDWL